MGKLFVLLLPDTGKILYNFATNSDEAVANGKSATGLETIYAYEVPTSVIIKAYNNYNHVNTGA